MSRRVVIALGGNSLQQKGEKGSYDEERLHVTETMRNIAPLLAERDTQAVITHGNGPQVGNILIQNAAAANLVPPMPMFVCGAMSQGEIGYLLQQSLANVLREKNVARNVSTVVTQVVVDASDPAFASPTKPVGPFYTEAEAKELAAHTGFAFKEDAGRGWRRVVPSPEPLYVQEVETVQELLHAGITVIAVGGGGIPVAYVDGNLQGMDAVIDKDKASALLADLIDADTLLILTAVPHAFLQYGKSGAKALNVLSVADAERYLSEGQFAEGSMKPKIEACVRFVKNSPVRKALVTSGDKLADAMQEKAGTWITA